MSLSVLLNNYSWYWCRCCYCYFSFLTSLFFLRFYYYSVISNVIAQIVATIDSFTACYFFCFLCWACWLFGCQPSHAYTINKQKKYILLAHIRSENEWEQEKQTLHVMVRNEKERVVFLLIFFSRHLFLTGCDEMVVKFNFWLRSLTINLWTLDFVAAAVVAFAWTIQVKLFHLNLTACLNLFLSLSLFLGCLPFKFFSFVHGSYSLHLLSHVIGFFCCAIFCHRLLANSFLCLLQKIFAGFFLSSSIADVC